MKFGSLDSAGLKRIFEDAHPPDPPVGTYRLASVFLLLFEKEIPHFLAIQKSDNEGYPWRNQIALPGGHVDRSDAGPQGAAFRELMEEVNIPDDQVELVGSLGHFETIRNRIVMAYTGIWNRKGPIRYDRAEISRVLEIPLDSLFQAHKERGYNGRVPDVFELIYPLDDTRIWGLTARILHSFIELLYPYWYDDGSS